VVTLGFVEAKSDTSLFIHHHGAEIAYLILYVDDIVLTASSQSLICRLVDALQREFPVKDLGVLHHFLGSPLSLAPPDSYFTSGSTLLTFWSGPR
jgi:hypothetical protein